MPIKSTRQPSGSAASNEDDDSDAAPMRGIKTVVETLRGEDFPMERRDIDYAIGDMEIEDGQGGWVPVRDLTDLLHDDSFASAEHVIRALQSALHRSDAA